MSDLAEILRRLDAVVLKQHLTDEELATGRDSIREIRRIVSDPENPQNHERRITTVEAQQGALWERIWDKVIGSLRFADGSKKPWLLLVIVVLAAVGWGIRTVYIDFQDEIKASIAEMFEREAEADSARAAASAASRQRNVHDIQAGIDSVKDAVESLAPDAP